MRVATRLLGTALGLPHPRTLRTLARSATILPPPVYYHHRRFASFADFEPPEDDPELDRPAKDIEREERKRDFTFQTRFFPKWPTFIPSEALKGERDFYFPPSSSSPTRRTTEWPKPTMFASEQALNDLPQYRSAHAAFSAIEKVLLTKHYESEQIRYADTELPRIEQVRLARQAAALAEQAEVDRLNQERLSRLSPGRQALQRELEVGRVLAAVPWTTSRFQMSNALEADAFVLFPGESIVAGTGAVENEVAESVTVDEEPSPVVVNMEEKPVVQKELSPKQKTAARKKEENKEKKRLKEEKNAKRKTDMQRRAQWKSSSWLAILFDHHPFDLLRIEDWNAAINYYRELECEICESHALPYRRELRARRATSSTLTLASNPRRALGQGFADQNLFKDFAEPGDSWRGLEEERRIEYERAEEERRRRERESRKELEGRWGLAPAETTV